MSSNQSNLLTIHSKYVCEDNFEQLTDILNYYLSQFRPTNNNKNYNYIPSRSNLSNKERYYFVFNQIKRCIYSRFSDLCNTHFISFQDYLTLINNYAQNICNNPIDYWKHFTNNKKYKKYNLNIDKEVKNIRHSTNSINSRNFKTLTHISVIYSLMKLLFLLEHLYEKNINPNDIQIIFSYREHRNINYNGVLKNCEFKPSNKDVNKQLFALMKSIYDIYYGTYIYNIYLNGIKFIDTNNNLFLRKWSKTNNINNNNLFYYTRLHLGTNLKGYFFKCDEFMGNNIQEKINKLSYQYLGNVQQRYLVPKLKSNSHNYSSNKIKKVCPENQVSHFLQLFYPNEQSRLYNYIKNNQNVEDYLFAIFLNNTKNYISSF
jgi:hypothetical protein